MDDDFLGQGVFALEEAQYVDSGGHSGHGDGLLGVAAKDDMSQQVDDLQGAFFFNVEEDDLPVVDESEAAVCFLFVVAGTEDEFET